VAREIEASGVPTVVMGSAFDVSSQAVLKLKQAAGACDD
jgi:hypothetical protein